MITGLDSFFRRYRTGMTGLLIVVLWLSGPGTVHPDAGLDRSAGVVKKFEFRKSSDGSETVSVFLDGFLTPKIFSLDGENPRVVCDFADLKTTPGLASRHVFPGRFLRAVRLAHHRSPYPKLRIVFDLVPGIPIDVSPYFFQEECIFALTLSVSRTNDP